jgi:hypothetical protein
MQRDGRFWKIQEILGTAWIEDEIGLLFFAGETTFRYSTNLKTLEYINVRF